MKIAVLVSGGVDSSVALRLLKDQGHDVTAFYLKIWLEDELSYLGSCPWEEDLAYVRALCAQADVPFELVSAQKEYWDHVVRHTIAEIKAGRTPNPDILCNSRIKFGFFLDYIRTVHGDSFDKVATGHYAQLACPATTRTYRLKRSPDEIKDQTYFLSHLRQDQLARLLLPIGHLRKADVRDLAQRFDLPSKDRKDSQGICFLGKLKFSDFIRHYLGDVAGPLIEYETGMSIGTHNGFWYYTIGQRQGIGLAGGPWYVVAKNPENNTVFVSRDYYCPDKKRDRFQISSLNWFGCASQLGGSLQVKLRHGPQMHSCQITGLADDRAQVLLGARDQGIAPGQFAVFYEGDMCVGSGVIL